MPCKTKRKNNFVSGAAGHITQGIAIGAIPNVNNSASVSTMKTGAARGLENVGKTYPTHGKLAGAGMVMKATDRLKSKSKKLY